MFMIFTYTAVAIICTTINIYVRMVFNGVRPDERID